MPTPLELIRIYHDLGKHVFDNLATESTEVIKLSQLCRKHFRKRDQISETSLVVATWMQRRKTLYVWNWKLESDGDVIKSSSAEVDQVKHSEDQLLS